MASAAHALKGSVGLFSKGAPYNAARALEQAAKTEDVEAFDIHLNELEPATMRLCEELRALRDKLSANRPATT
jgi:HPt (histidine-containing phosphotransfer) domain-containing protein